MEKVVAGVPVLLEGLKSSDSLTRRYAIYGLERLNHRESTPEIATCLRDPDPWVRRTAAVALGKMGVKESAPAVARLLRDADPYVRYDAVIALVRLGVPSTQRQVFSALKGTWVGELTQGFQENLVQVLALPFFDDAGVRPFLAKLVEQHRKGKSSALVGRTAAVILAEKYKDASGEDILIAGLSADDYAQQDCARALGILKSKKAVPELVKILSSEWTNNRRYAIEALGEIGGLSAATALESMVACQDYRLRKAAAQALERFDGNKREIAPEPAAATIPALPPEEVKVPGDRRPVQFIVLGVDDCANVEGLESLEEICETLRARGSRAVFTLWVAPLAGSFAPMDLEKKKLLYQRLFDLGCEFAHHTVHHNPGGIFWTALPREQQVEEIEGWTSWMRQHVEGFSRAYSFKGGGGGRGREHPLDTQFSDQLIARQRFLYSAAPTARGRRGPVHPDSQVWPVAPVPPDTMWRIPTGCLDAAAPPVHTEITDPIFSDYPGRFDYPVAEGVRMWKANFEYHYNHPRRPILAVNAFHDWGLRGIRDPFLIRASHRTEGTILKEFLLDVLVKNRERYPETYCVTFSQVLEYCANGGNLERTLAIGNGQDRRNPLRPSFLPEDEPWPPPEERR